ncbi:MAG: site-specific integrase, partial [Deltaproteobacteria bacterium]|nr:site-specific integrase [Deltaproteobacteria bacterium]
MQGLEPVPGQVLTPLPAAAAETPAPKPPIEVRPTPTVELLEPARPQPVPGQVPVALAEKKTIVSGILWENAGFWAHLDSFLKVQNSPHTQRAYQKDLEEFLVFLKTTGKPMNVHTLVEYRDQLKTRPSERTGQPLSHVSINRKIATLRSFLNWLVLNGVIPNNPAKAVHSFRAGRESPTRDIPNDRVKMMLDHAEHLGRHKIAGRLHHAILMVLFHLGLRRAELVGLRTSDFFEQDGARCIRVRGKGDKERVLPLPGRVAQAIDAYLS